MRSSASAAARISSSVMIGSSVFTIVCDQSRSRSASASGMPSIAEMTVNGSGNARSAMTSIGAPSPDLVELLVDEFLRRAVAAARDHARREGLLHEAAEAGVVGRIAPQHRRAALAHRTTDHFLDVLALGIEVRRHARARVAEHSVHVVESEHEPRTDRQLVHPRPRRASRCSSGTGPRRSRDP